MTRSDSDPDTTGFAFRVAGRVQGVGFRWWTQSQADSLGLTGTVRNTSDGHVEVLAWGSAEALTTLEERLHQGPASAKVERVEATPAPPARAPTDFRIIP